MYLPVEWSGEHVESLLAMAGNSTFLVVAARAAEEFDRAVRAACERTNTEMVVWLERCLIGTPMFPFCADDGMMPVGWVSLGLREAGKGGVETSRATRPRPNVRPVNFRLAWRTGFSSPGLLRCAMQASNWPNQIGLESTSCAFSCYTEEHLMY
jgi:hypothetical protein